MIHRFQMFLDHVSRKINNEISKQNDAPLV